MDENIRIVIVDDSLPFRDGLRKSFELVPEVALVGEAEDGETSLSLIESLQPDVALLDCRLPGMNGVQVAVTLKQMCAPTNVLACSAYEDEEYVRGMLEAGALGYLLKDEPPEKIIEAIRWVARGQNWFSSAIVGRFAKWLRAEQSESPKLTKRELAVLHLLAQGKSNHQIAQELCVTERTLRFHLGNIYTKLGVHSDREAIIWAIQHKLRTR